MAQRPGLGEVADEGLEDDRVGHRPERARRQVPGAALTLRAQRVDEAAPAARGEERHRHEAGGDQVALRHHRDVRRRGGGVPWAALLV